jgi:hypothetical protein
MLIHAVELSTSNERFLLKVDLFEKAISRHRKLKIKPENLAIGLLRNDDDYNIKMIYYYFDICILYGESAMVSLFYCLAYYIFKNVKDFEHFLKNLDDYTSASKSHYLYYSYSEKNKEDFENIRRVSGLVADAAAIIDDNELLAQVVHDTAEYLVLRVA